MSLSKVKVCYILSYRDVEYIRTRTLVSALESLEHVELYQACNTHSGLGRYFQTLKKLIEIRLEHDPDVYLLGFRGHEIFWLTRMITRNKPLIFDSFVSPSSSLIDEMKYGLHGRAIGKMVQFFESKILKASDFLLTDTILHSKLFVEEFGISESRVRHIYVGADPMTRTCEPVESNQMTNSKEKFNVLFYGTFLPLHGVDIILQATKLLSDTPIVFTIVGGNEEQFTKMNGNLGSSTSGNIKYYSWIEFSKLRDCLIPSADVCLGGPFGGTDQARRVISGKTFQFLAQGKVTVIGNIEEEVGFINRFNCLLIPQKDPVALAEALRWSLNNRCLVADIGRNARKLYCEKFDIPIIASNLSEIVELVR